MIEGVMTQDLLSRAASLDVPHEVIEHRLGCRCCAWCAAWADFQDDCRRRARNAFERWRMRELLNVAELGND
jgi:hypothetical protein